MSFERSPASPHDCNQRGWSCEHCKRVYCWHCDAPSTARVLETVTRWCVRAICTLAFARREKLTMTEARKTLRKLAPISYAEGSTSAILAQRALAQQPPPPLDEEYRCGCYELQAQGYSDGSSSWVTFRICGTLYPRCSCGCHLGQAWVASPEEPTRELPWVGWYEKDRTPRFSAWSGETITVIVSPVPDNWHPSQGVPNGSSVQRIERRDDEAFELADRLQGRVVIVFASFALSGTF